MKITYEIRAGGKQITESVTKIHFRKYDDILYAVCERPDREHDLLVPITNVIEIV